MRSLAHQRGFTLIELMIVVVLLGITAAIAVPNFGRMIDNNQHAAAANDFSGLLHFARSEAIRRGNGVVVYAIDTSDGNAGYAVCIGSALAACKGGTANPEQLLRASNKLPGRIDIAHRLPSGSPDLVFRGSGMIAGSSNYEYRICGDTGTEAVDISVNAGGQIRLITDTNVTCS